MIEYRQLRENECERIEEIDPTTYVKRAWREVNGVKQWIDLNWLDEDFPAGYDVHLEALQTTFKTGGFAIGAFDTGRLVGFCSVNQEAFGNQFKYVLLDQIFISKDHKRQGIGKKLFHLAVEKAKRWHVDKLYICSSSSEDTLAFYSALNCEEAKEVNQKLYEADVNDVQLEFDLHG